MVSNPIEGYDSFTVGEVEEALSQYENGLDALNAEALRERRSTVADILEYEQANKDRVTATEAIEDVLDAIDEQLADPPVSSEGEIQDDEDDTEDTADNDEEEVEEVEEEPVEEDDADDNEDEPEGSVPESSADVDEAAFSGADESERILVRNPNKDSRNIAGFGFSGGEVKDVVLNDRVRSALERGRLQYVSDN